MGVVRSDAIGAVHAIGSSTSHAPIAQLTDREYVAEAGRLLSQRPETLDRAAWERLASLVDAAAAGRPFPIPSAIAGTQALSWHAGGIARGVRPPGTAAQ